MCSPQTDNVSGFFCTEDSMDRLNSIIPADASACARAKEVWNGIAKPLGSLGLLEQDIISIAGMRRSEKVALNKRCVVVMCADNGVVEENVTQSKSDVTATVAKSIAEGSSNINLIADVCRADVFAVDIGICSDIYSPNLIDRKVSYGTANITKGPAMTVGQAQKAVTAGMDIVSGCLEKGYDIIVTGEMGIGNTTTSAAVASVLLNADPSIVTGRGAGLDGDGLSRKINAVRKAIATNQPSFANAFDILSKVGGLDIAGMMGLFLGGAVYHVPVVIDGFISAAAAALAVRVNPIVRDYLICSHVSKEPAGKMLLDLIGIKPAITAEMHLGEGTGGVMLLPMLDSALAVYNSSHRFDTLKMSRYKEFTT